MIDGEEQYSEIYCGDEDGYPCGADIPTYIMCNSEKEALDNAKDLIDDDLFDDDIVNYINGYDE